MTGLAILDSPEVVRELYGRYKRLALAAAAELIAGGCSPELAGEVHELYEDSARARLDACALAAADLERLVAAGADSDAASSRERLERVRLSHSDLRRKVWTVIGCEYVPCNAGAAVHRERSSDV